VKIKESIEFEIKLLRKNLANRCTALAADITRVARELESDMPHQHLSINRLGEIQSKGTIIDAECGRLSAKIDVLLMLLQKKDDE